MDTRQRIVDLVASNPGQMVEVEYSAIAEELQARGPCSLLVFGLGKDTPLWSDLNQNGKTAFLEGDARWIAKMRTAAIDVHWVEYTTRLEQAEELKKREGIPMLLPSQVRQRVWDVILVDAPPGEAPGRPGRFQSIYEASRLAAPDACVFVHDIDRPVEKWFSNRFLGKPLEVVHRLGVFGTKAKRPRR